jgi:hypothetical protein
LFPASLFFLSLDEPSAPDLVSAFPLPVDSSFLGAVPVPLLSKSRKKLERQRPTFCADSAVQTSNSMLFN